MPYDMNEVRKRVREYIAVRHPGLHLDEPCSLTVTGEPDGWFFLIEYRNHAMSSKDLRCEFNRYTVDRPQGSMEAWEGLGNDYITVRSGKPLLIGDGDDSGAVTAQDGAVAVWLRAL